MRKKQKKMIMDLLGTLNDAHEDLKGLIQSGRREQASCLLSNCQEAAVSIGSAIESAEGNGTLAVTVLEEYCEMLYRISTELEQIKDAYKPYKLLKKQLNKIYVLIKDQIPTSYEVAFMPYKASMWDSLESIWMAANEDSDCNCHVISVPYFDKNPDGSFGQMHDERAQYPDYVPMTDYRDYDLSVVKPDVIFFHNPYDQYNYVTSVHPKYYSSELRECTDLLVYVPYYIVLDDVPEHFCLTAGVMNAHLTVVQSEKIRQTYLNTWKQQFNWDDKQAKRMGAFQKIVALGSPKMDKVMSKRKEELRLPDSWKEKIFY